MLVQALPEELWLAIEPLLPPVVCRHGTHISDRRALEGVLFILRTGMGRNALPTQLTCGSPTTLWRRMRSWQEQGCWSEVEALLRAGLPDGDRLNWQRLYARGRLDAARPTTAALAISS